MPGVARTPNRVSHPTGRRLGGGILSDEHKARRNAGDFSCFAPILPENDRPPSTPDHDKDLPRIPSTSTGLWGDEAVTVLTGAMGSLATSPIVGCPPLPVPSHSAHERVSITEAQQIVVQYRQRLPSSLIQNSRVSENPPPNANTDSLESLRASPSSTMMQSGVSTNTKAMNAPVEVSLASSQSSSTRRALVGETETSHTLHESTNLFSRVHEDGTVSCTRGDCLAVLPNSRAFSLHSHIHRIHDEYVVHPRCVQCGLGALTMLPLIG